MWYTRKKEQAMKGEIARLKNEVADLSQIVKTQELIRLRSENERLKELELLVSKLRFRLKDVAYLVEEDVMLVKYEVPYAKVGFDADGNPLKNDFFYAINKLQLIPLDDMKKISAELDEIKKRKTKQN